MGKKAVAQIGGEKVSDEKFRHEYKYIISAAQLEILKVRTAAIMQIDQNLKPNNKFGNTYNVRSVYFDDWQHNCYYDNEDGVNKREKFRIRIYNHSDERISLELKRKENGMCRKQSCLISKNQCEQLLSGKVPNETADMHPLLRKFILQQRTRILKPTVIVEYDRIPYVYPIGNVRVTFDCNIRASSECGRFLEENILLRPILPEGQHILEMKWDELMPEFIYRSMMLESLQWTSFSKFYLSQKINLL